VPRQLHEYIRERLPRSVGDVYVTLGCTLMHVTIWIRIAFPLVAKYAINFELWFAQGRCDQTTTQQPGIFDSMKLLAPAVSNKQNEAHDAHRPSADTTHW